MSVRSRTSETASWAITVPSLNLDAMSISDGPIAGDEQALEQLDGEAVRHTGDVVCNLSLRRVTAFRTTILHRQASGIGKVVCAQLANHVLGPLRVLALI